MCIRDSYMGVIGEREATNGTVAVRSRGIGKKQEVMDRSSFIDRVLDEIQNKSLG